MRSQKWCAKANAKTAIQNKHKTLIETKLHDAKQPFVFVQNKLKSTSEMQIKPLGWRCENCIKYP